MRTTLEDIATFLHPNGLPPDPRPYEHKGLHLPGIASAQLELDALRTYVAANQAGNYLFSLAEVGLHLPTTQQLGRITLKQASGCWELPVYNDAACGTQTAPLARYGRMRIKGVTADQHGLAHRTMYRLMRGRDIQAGEVIDHLCENKACCWHRHLEAVSPRTNTLRGRVLANVPLAQQMLQFED